MRRNGSKVVAALTLAAAVACGREPARPAAAPARPDLVLITIDTLRADRVGRGLTPTLDALASRGVRFANARTAVPLTLPSHTSMLTGVLPPAHGVRENGIDTFQGSPPSIARRLQEAGYITAAFVGAYVLDRRFGLADGFDHYDDQIARDPKAAQRLEAERPANIVVDRAAAWLAAAADKGSDAAAAKAPLFLWVHFYDPHAPYAGSYDREVTFADSQAGRLLQELRTRGRDPIVIVTGDHGESLGEHGEATHGMLLYDGALRVPLIVAGPGIAAGTRHDPVSLIDIAPTLAALARLSGRADVAGADLLAAPVRDREIYAETQYPRVAGWSPVHALVQDRWKAIVSHGPELYDLLTDAAETHDVALSREALVRAMGARLDAIGASKTAPTARAAAPDVAERLRALGYVAGSSAPITPGEGPNPAAHIAAWNEFEIALTEMAQPGNKALPRLEKLSRAYPDARVFLSTYARALSDNGSSREALPIYRRAVARWPDDGTLFHELAIAARDAGSREEAVRAEQAALALRPNFPAASNGLGLLLTDADRHGDAARAFEAATTGDPTNAEYWVNLGNARRAAENASGAEAAYRQAAAIDPSSADAANGLGVLLVQQQRAEEAILLFERAISAAPDLIEARLNLGIAYQESGQRDRAAAAYREVLARARPGAPERRAANDLLRSLAR